MQLIESRPKKLTFTVMVRTNKTFVEHVITYKNEFAADYEPYTLTFTRGENNEGVLSIESKEGSISQRTINLNEYETSN